ncbi:glycosyl hydrolase [Neobacillus sp. 3P2-tot-E-2]|uniref:glycoside hydrolase family 26 protein n=1 Tax=Neobacillus sp. 3P2-tot-E-2 TaxID=3132212 RepID=UPI0039A0013D
MKKRVFPIVLIALTLAAAMAFYMFTKDPLAKEKSEISKSKDTPVESITVDKSTVENTYKPIPLNGLALWKNEKESQSSYPDGLDQITPIDDSFNNYKNNYYGYTFTFPANWTVDHHQVPYYTRFFNEDFRLDITVQNVDENWTTPQGYIKETIESVSPFITSNHKWQQSSLTFQHVEYTREVISGIENDMNHYSYYFISKNKLVYTFQLKSTQASYQRQKEAVKTLIDSFALTPIVEFDLNAKIKTTIQNTDLTLEHQYKTLYIPKNTFMMGIYTPNSYDIDTLESSIQQKIGAQMFYKPINSEYDPYTQELVDKNRLPIITFLYQEENNQNNKVVVKNILNGSYDKQLENWARQIKALDSPVLIRPGNEMNGEWSEWSSPNHYNDPDLYKFTFIHLVNVFKAAGATNAYFVWNPNHVSEPYYQWNEAAMYYPGDEVVDFVGMTSYNFGVTKWHGYQTFEELYDQLYWDYSRSYYNKPLIIGEVGAVEEGGNKAEWITQMFQDLSTKYPNIKMALWFDQTHSPFDLRIQTSPASLNAFQNGMNQSYVIKQLQEKNKE